MFFLLALLRAVSPPDDAEAERLIAENDALYAKVRAVGGTHYPVNALRLTAADWHAHYGDRWPAFRAARRGTTPGACSRPVRAIFRMPRRTRPPTPR